jgi:hypothetical protein
MKTNELKHRERMVIYNLQRFAKKHDGLSLGQEQGRSVITQLADGSVRDDSVASHRHTLSPKNSQVVSMLALSMSPVTEKRPGKARNIST